MVRLTAKTVRARQTDDGQGTSLWGLSKWRSHPFGRRTEGHQRQSGGDAMTRQKLKCKMKKGIEVNA